MFHQYNVIYNFDTDELLFGFAGSLPYMAPEIIEKIGYSKEVDIWSAGVVLYVLLGDNFPYEGEDLAGTLRCIKKSDPNLETGEWRQVSESCKDLIKRMLNKDVNKRLRATEILGKPWNQKIHVYNMFDFEFKWIAALGCIYPLVTFGILFYLQIIHG